MLGGCEEIMATLELCDLCNGKVKRDFIKVEITGSIQLYEGNPPELPKGFKYREGETATKRLMKTWDAFGNYQGAVEFVDKPPKHKHMRITYELCENCGQKLANMLEGLRRQYHLENKEVELIGNPSKAQWPFFGGLLGYDEGED